MTKKEALLEEENEKLKKEFEEYKEGVRLIKDIFLSDLYFAVKNDSLVEPDKVCLLLAGMEYKIVSKKQYRLIHKILEENDDK